jgi:glycosyltransferase involved in cell wall biosynthesis
VAFFHRKPRALGNFSIETYFQQIREYLPPPFQPVYVEMPYESNGLWRRLANAIYSFFKQEDINHITGDINYVACLLNKRKTILTIHDLGNLHDSNGIKHWLLMRFWYKIPFAQSCILTANSLTTKKDMIKTVGCETTKIRVIYICSKNIYQFHHKHFNSSKPRILHIGTAPNKNLHRLIQALKNIDCRLVIIGKVEGSLRTTIADQNLEVEIIDRKLTDTEILEQYHLCDILSLVSTLEGFGIPIIEANAVGRVVITSNLTSMPEVAQNAAHLVDPYDINSISEGFKYIIKNPEYREILIKNGLQNQLRFQPREITNSYCAIYSEILNNKKNLIKV